MALIDEVKTRLGASSAYLIELTNQDPSAVTVNDSMLQACCDDAEGMFEDITGIVPVISNRVHLSHLIDVVIYYLEQYKARDSSLLTGRRATIISNLSALRRRQSLLATTNSKIQKKTDVSDTLDFDRNRMPCQRKINAIRRYNECE
jgi:hypothetical protein